MNYYWIIVVLATLLLIGYYSLMRHDARVRESVWQLLREAQNNSTDVNADYALDAAGCLDCHTINWPKIEIEGLEAESLFCPCSLHDRRGYKRRATDAVLKDYKQPPKGQPNA